MLNKQNMKCTHCKKKKGLSVMDCRYCHSNYCSSCIQLEIHNCQGIQSKCKEELDNLEKKLAFSPKKKHDFIC